MPSRRARAASVIFAAVLLVASSRTAAQACAPDWTPGLFPDASVDGDVFALITFDDDGPGPHAPVLIAAGNLEHVAGTVTTHIAQWDGVAWSPLGTGTNAFVHALAVFDEDGPGPNPARLFAGGGFTTAGGSPATGIARWDGVSWSAVGGGVDTAATFAPGVWDMIVYDKDGPGPTPPALYVGGGFTTAGGIAANGLARWSGSAWSVVGQPGTGGTPPGSAVTKLAIFDDDGPGPNPPKLAAGGSYLPAGGLPNNGVVALWDGATWSILGAAFDGAVYALAGFDPDGGGPMPEVLYAGGAFHFAGALAVGHVARWTGTTWAALGSGVTAQVQPPIPDADVFALASFDDDGTGPMPPFLYVGGRFTFASGMAVANIARWSGSAWFAVGTGVANVDTSDFAYVRAFLLRDADGRGPDFARLVVGGTFQRAGPVGVHGVAAWSNGGWEGLGKGPNGEIRALVAFDSDGGGPAPASLFACGSFVFGTPSGLATNAALWNGSAWSLLGLGLPAPVFAATTFDLDGNPATPPSLIVGGNFGAASWNGTTWISIGAIPVLVRSLAVFDEDDSGPQPPSLFAGGILTGSPPTSCPEIRKWTGTTWAPLGAGLGNCSTAGPGRGVYALAVFDDDGVGPGIPHLFAAGNFTLAAGSPALNVARWDGTAWQPLGAGLGGGGLPIVRALFVHDPDGAGALGPQLFAGGAFTSSGATPLAYVARWDGAAWQGVSGGIFPSTYTEKGVNVLGAFDLDGPGPGGPALVAGGSFVAAGGILANNIASWDGATWSPLGNGTSGGSGSATFTPPGRVFALLPFDEDGGGPLPAASYAGGDFSQAGGASSGDLARWGVPPALALGLTITGSGALSVGLSSCIPGGNSFVAFSTDSLNAAAPGSGGFAGLHVAPSDLVLEFQSGGPPFIGVLDASGAAQTSVDSAIIAPLTGTTVYAVAILFHPAPLLGYFFTASAVVPITL